MMDVAGVQLPCGDSMAIKMERTSPESRQLPGACGGGVKLLASASASQLDGRLQAPQERIGNAGDMGFHW